MLVTFYNLCELSLCEKSSYHSTVAEIYLKPIAFQNGKTKDILKNQGDNVQAKDAEDNSASDESLKNSVYGKKILSESLSL